MSRTASRLYYGRQFERDRHGLNNDIRRNPSRTPSSVAQRPFSRPSAVTPTGGRPSVTSPTTTTTTTSTTPAAAATGRSRRESDGLASLECNQMGSNNNRDPKIDLGLSVIQESSASLSDTNDNAVSASIASHMSHSSNPESMQQQHQQQESFSEAGTSLDFHRDATNAQKGSPDDLETSEQVALLSQQVTQLQQELDSWREEQQQQQQDPFEQWQGDEERPDDDKMYTVDSPMEEEEDRLNIPADSYSFIMTSSHAGPIIYGTLVFLLQSLTFAAVLIDEINLEMDGNALNIPASVGLPTRFTQVMAILMMVPFQEDTRQSVILWSHGYQKEWFEEHCTYRKWLVSLTCRFVMGSLGLCSYFVAVMTSSTVMDVLLDFAGLAFISFMDDLAFAMAHEGFITKQIKNESERVYNASYPAKKRVLVWGRAYLITVYLALFAGWLVIFYNQKHGVYLDQTLFIQFGDEYPEPDLATFSGLYDLQDSRMGDRHFYLERRSGGRAKFSYCDSLESWTFTYDKEDGRDMDSCSWSAMSASTSTFDITTTSLAPWLAQNDKQNKGPLQHFWMSCYDCLGQDDSQVCTGENGVWDGSECVCMDGYYGLNCEFGSPCETLETDSTLEGFNETVGISDQFSLFRTEEGVRASSYSRPVFLSEAFDVILFTGRRWAIFSYENKDKLQLEEFLSNGFHAHFSNLSVSLLSEPVGYGTPFDGSTPAGLSWYRAQEETTEGQPGIGPVDLRRRLDTVLRCAT